MGLGPQICIDCYKYAVYDEFKHAYCPICFNRESITFLFCLDNEGRKQWNRVNPDCALAKYMSDKSDKFYEIAYDSAGNERKILKAQIDPEPLDESGFTHYDSSEGHCALCGSLRCRGYCMGGG